MSNEIDTEKIRELNESLRELTGTVNVAEQAVEKIVTRLGFGDKLKKKVEERTEAEDKATTSIDKSTAAIDEERKKREETSKAQAEQFRKELSYRKVAVDANNELVSTAVQLSKAQRDTLRLADQLNKKEREKLAYKDDPGKTVSGLTDKFSASGAVLNSFNDQILSLTSNSTALTLSYLGAKAGLTGLIDATAAMTKSLYKGERGAMVTANAFSSLTDAIAPFLQALGPIVSILAKFTPIGRIAQGLAWGLTAVGLAAPKAADALKVAAQQNDDLFKSFNTLSQAGLTTADGMNGVFDQLQTLGMTVAEIEKFNTLLKTNSKDLKLFGATTAEGAKNFANIAGTLYKSDLGEKLELLGVTADEQRDHTLRYMAQQTRMGLSLGKTQEQQIQGAKAYIEELDRLATLTGTNRKEQEEAREAMLKIEDLRAAQFEAEQRGDTKRAEELERYAKAAAAIYKFDPRGAKGLAEFGAAGGPTGADSSAAMLTYGKGINAIKQGKSTEEIMMAMSESAKAMLKTTSTTRRIGGDVSGMLSGKFPEMVDFVKSMDAARELVGQGKAANINEALDKIQKDKEAGLDKDTKNNVEAGRKQQAAAMTMDSVVKTFNISAKINNEASELFNDAVNKFANTVGAKPVVGGTPQTSGGGAPVSPNNNTPVSSTQQAAQTRITTQQAVESAQATREKLEKEKGRGADDTKEARIAEMRAREAAERARREEETAIRNKARGITPPTGNTQKDKAKEPVTVPSKEKHSAASLKAMGLPLKEGDVHADGKELDTRLIEIAKKAKDTIPGFSTITAFNDNFHNEPGRRKSLHTEGKAFDFKLNYTPTIEQGKEIAKMLKGMGAGYVLDEYNFPSPGSSGPHFHAQLAQDGGEFSGPSSGYPVMLHGKETVLNKIQGDKLKQKLEQVEKKSVETSIPGLGPTSSNNTGTSNTEVVAMLKEFTNTMENKMDNMIGVLSDGNDISGKILTYSMA
jgi:predicted RNA-binding protein with RPS1 domain